MRAYLVLEDGSVYEGTACGAFREVACEVVFNTSMTGYLKVLTDPSYAGQGIVMTYPMIGNYGVSMEDCESARLQPVAFIVHELCQAPSNFRNEKPLEEVLEAFGIPCISGIDTRSVVKRLRESGTMRGLITDDCSDPARCAGLIAAFTQAGLVESVSTKHPIFYGSDNSGPSVALLDCGTKYNIAKSLERRGCRVTVYPCGTSAQDILAGGHDGLMLSNGPGDPADCKDIIREVRKLYDAGIPTFAICLGHQLMALATGGKTVKMKYGHRGANHPVKFTADDTSFITSQNHGYMVCAEGLPKNAEISCVNVNDKTVEGVVYHGKPLFTVQFHPEASPGPRDTAFLFDRFIDLMGKGGCL